MPNSNFQDSLDEALDEIEGIDLERATRDVYSDEYTASDCAAILPSNYFSNKETLFLHGSVHPPVIDYMWRQMFHDQVSFSGLAFHHIDFDPPVERGHGGIISFLTSDIFCGCSARLGDDHLDPDVDSCYAKEEGDFNFDI